MTTTQHTGSTDAGSMHSGDTAEHDLGWRPTFDEHGELCPPTAETCLAVFTEWARRYPCARFLVIAMAPGGADAVELGWGLASAEGVFAHLPAIPLSGGFTTAGNLLRLLRHGMDARLIWVDPEPEYVA
ncbi:MAG: hypothetical protein ACRDRN_08515 [Sciscionella sp.]